MKYGVGLALVASLAIAATTARAQEIAVGERKGNVTAVVEELLARPTTVDVTRATLSQAIDAAAASARVVVQYQVWMLDAYETPVTLHVKNMPLRDVLEHVLSGTTLRVVPDGNTRLTIVEVRNRGEERPAVGGVQGVVRDAKTSQVLRGATVTLDDTVSMTRTNEDGRYRFASATVGAHRLSVRLVGYARQSKVVTVVDGHAADVDFMLESTVNTLDQVVVTATGAQRYRELGHVVTQLNADSLVRSAPITTMAQLLQSRVPGLQVMNGSGGLAGGEVAFRIRGQTTINLDPQPIVIVDGVRYKNTNTLVDNGQGANVVEDRRPFSVQQRSPLNDLNVNDIESVEVVKGPSASTLYGPDAANGVIVITTKRGQAGTPKWNFYVHPNLADITSQNTIRPQTAYWGWGHVPGGSTPFRGSCTLNATYYGQCVLDSVTPAPTAESSPDLKIVARQRPQWQSGLSVSGGVSMFRYFFSGGYDSQVGSLQIPHAAAVILASRLGPGVLADAIKDPNTQQTLTLRSNVSADLNAQATVAMSVSYSRATQRQIALGAYQSLAIFGALDPTCLADSLRPCRNDVSTFIRSSHLDGNRFNGGVNGTFRPNAWLTMQGSLGMDLDGTVDRALVPQGILATNSQGQLSEYRRDNTGRNGTFNTTAHAHHGRFSFQTTAGADYHYTNLDGLNLDAYNLAPGSSSAATASQLQVRPLWTETVSLGAYGEEVVGWNDQLYFTGSMRYDGSTSFGDAYHPRPFPKLGLSWIASEEPLLKRLDWLDQLRIRVSYGASTRYPTSSMKIGLVQSGQTGLTGPTSFSYQRTLLANPLIQPERSHEAEGGVDATLFAQKLELGLTWFSRRTNDVIQFAYDPQGLPGQWINVGDVSAHGWEVTATAHLFQTRSMQGTMTFTGSFSTDRLLSLGRGRPISDQQTLAGFGVGYPLSAVFDRTITGVADTVGGSQDGIILSQEIVFSPFHYVGVLNPPYSYTLTPAVSFLDGRVRLSSLIDRETGFIVPDYYTRLFGTVLLTPGSAPMAQALAQSNCCVYDSGNFTRWRELSVSADLPSRYTSFLRLSRGTVSFYVRNLALWTQAKSGDPESLVGQGLTGVNSVQSPIPGIAQPRSWSISFDLVP